MQHTCSRRGTTARQLQDAIHTHQLDNLKTSPWHDYSTEELIQIRASILANPRLNHKPAEIIQLVIDQRTA